MANCFVGTICHEYGTCHFYLHNYDTTQAEPCEDSLMGGCAYASPLLWSDLLPALWPELQEEEDL